MNLENKNIYSTNLDDFSPKNKWVLLGSLLTSCRTTFANALSNLRTLPFITDLKFLGPLAKDSTLLNLLSTSTVPPDYWILSVGVTLTLRTGVSAKKEGGRGMD